ncbi:MAG TPA: hypothetical protein VGW38_02800 [Chloroflexota bacterium]|nr:hypothetical protein [Chloroflexota bacterium]
MATPSNHNPQSRSGGLDEARDNTKNRSAIPTIARWAEVSGTISKQFARLWTGEVSAKQVVADLSTEVKPLLEPRL